MIRIHGRKIMLIDFSYYILHRYHALKAWCRFSKTSFTDDEFLTRFYEKFEPEWIKLTKQYGVSPKNVLFVGDCKRESIWRKRIDSEYKSNRDNLSECHVLPSSFFEIIYNKIVPEITAKYNNQFVCFDEMEADDIISIIVSKCGDIDITIITNDNDYLQLNKDNVHIFNLKSLNICSRGTGEPWKDLTMKILTGDASDNIKSVCSKKIANGLIQKNMDEFNKYIDENGLRTKYEHNRLLIDFDLIPIEYVEKVVSNLEICSH
jgi:5'-3' exonuclease